MRNPYLVLGPLSRRMLLAGVLTGGVLPLPGAPPGGHPAKEVTPAAKEPAASPSGLVEAFMRGPISISAKVVRPQGEGVEASLPLFQVPVLEFGDRLEMSFTGEAFDPRVTRADWSLVVVFLPKTVAPTEQGVVSFRLKRKAERMTVPDIPVPYDSIPMLFLIPDKTGRKKVLKDLNAHLESFRNLCAKISDLSAERATVDTFIADLDAIDKTMSPAQYDNAVLSFLHTYGNGVSLDVQAFVATGASNLRKCQFLTDEIQKTNVLVPDPAASPSAAATATVAAGGTRPLSAYVSIFFDVATIISNLWPGHQFQYLPALARNFHGDGADLYYTDWIHTTGDTLGALMCCPGKWEDRDAPAFAVEFPAGESMQAKQVLLKARPKDKDRKPFGLFGHDWKLLLADPKGESLPPLPLMVSPGKDAFVASPGPLLEPLKKVGATKVKARIVGRWGFTSFDTEFLEIPVTCDPAWAPTAREKAAFKIGENAAFKFPAAWAGLVEKVQFQPAAAHSKPMVAKLKATEDGGREAEFQPKADAGKGALEVFVFGADRPALTVPMTLLAAPPEVSDLEARLGETRIILMGRHLDGVHGVELGGRRFVHAPDPAETEEAIVLRAEDGKPLDGAVGVRVTPSLLLPGGTQEELKPVSLKPARPRMGEALVVPMALKGTGLPFTSALPVAPTCAPSQVSLTTAKGYRFPSDGAFHLAIRNSAEPMEIRTIPPAKIRLMGNNQKSTFPLIPADLLGGRASGKLEVQCVDEHAGSSDWLPLPPTFLDLPNIASIQALPTGARLIGPSLDVIEALAPSPTGPWEKVTVAIEDGHEAINLSSNLQGGPCYLKVFGWPDLVLSLKVPAFPLSAPSPVTTDSRPAQAQQGESSPPAEPGASKPGHRATSPAAEAGMPPT